MKATNKKVKAKNETTSSMLRVKSELYETIKSDIERLNKLKKGSKTIHKSELVELAYSLLPEEQKLTLIERTITSQDRQKVAFANYIKKHKNTSKDEFLDLIQYGEVQINDYLPDEMKRVIKPKNVKSLDVA